MAFVKIDCGILDSTLWVDRPAREVFITALLMAIPYELEEPVEQFHIRTNEVTGWNVPPGWYGFVHAASIGIVRRSGIEEEEGYEALERLSTPEQGSRSPDYDGRRMVRIEGGFLILNYQKYRERDYTAADRARRYRDRKSRRNEDESRRDKGVTSCNVTQAEAEAEGKKKKTDIDLVFDFWRETFKKPRAVKDAKRERIILRALKDFSVDDLKQCLRGYVLSEFHMGKNDRMRQYVDLELLLRDSKHIEEGMALAGPEGGETPPGKKWFRDDTQEPQA